jgi:hypothetical protein
MTRNPAVLIGTADAETGDRISGWVARLGYEARIAAGSTATMALVRGSEFSASFLDSGMGSGEADGVVWRRANPILGRRLVLMARNPREVWFEALGAGVGAVLPLPPQERMVLAALAAVGAPYA